MREMLEPVENTHRECFDHPRHAVVALDADHRVTAYLLHCRQIDDGLGAVDAADSHPENIATGRWRCSTPVCEGRWRIDGPNAQYAARLSPHSPIGRGSGLKIRTVSVRVRLGAPYKCG